MHVYPIYPDRTHSPVRLIILLVALASAGWAATHYVVPPGTIGVTPTNPYTNWATAGTNLIEVVAAAETNTAPRVVIVTNGVYYPTNRMVFWTTGVMLRSVNGRDVTIIDGLGGAMVTNNFLVMNSSADSTSIGIDGFTITNFNTPGAAVSGYNYSVLNCRFVNNSNYYVSGGNGNGTVQMIWGGVITNTIFQNNWVQFRGGAVYGSLLTSWPRKLSITGCTFENNRARDYDGGACTLGSSNVVVSNCVFINNRTSGKGGAIYFEGTNTYAVYNCTLISNMVDGQYVLKDGLGGAIYATTNLTIRNSLIALNSAKTNGGGVYISKGSVESCTIVTNYAGVSGGGLYINGTARGTNNIVYYNWTDGAPETHNFVNTAGDTGLDYSCVTPAVTGTDNITADPDLSADFQPRIDSPCINAGLNLPWMLEADAVDLDGRRRVDAINRRVDMGCHEFSFYGTMIKVR